MTSDMALGSLLRGRGHRWTRPRQLVWDVLHGAGAHLTVEEVLAAVHRVDDSVNLASVYRSLALFADLELARESRLAGETATRWEPAHPDEHFHLVCERCGEVAHHEGDLVEQIREHLTDGHDFAVDNVELTVTGRCAACRPHDP